MFLCVLSKIWRNEMLSVATKCDGPLNGFNVSAAGIKNAKKSYTARTRCKLMKGHIVEHNYESQKTKVTAIREKSSICTMNPWKAYIKTR